MTHKPPTALRKLAFRIAERIGEELGPLVAEYDTEDIAAIIYQELPFDLEEEARIEQELREKLGHDDETPTAPPAESPFTKLRDAVHATPEMSIMTVIEAAVAKLNRLDPPPGKCEHGVEDGEYCEPCNLEYKRAAKENAAEEKARLFDALTCEHGVPEGLFCGACNRTVFGLNYGA